MRIHHSQLLLAAVTIIICAPFCWAQESMEYPQTRKVDQVDEYFGEPVVDPYRWLEDDVRQSDEVRMWVEAQNEVSFAYINQLPYREEIESRLTK